MKTITTTKGIQKRIKYLLKSVNIPFEIAKALKWKDLYKILKKAQALNEKLVMVKKTLKQFSKDITGSNFSLNKETSITEFYDIDTKSFDKPKKEKFKFIPFIKPFLSHFLDDFPLLII